MPQSTPPDWLQQIAFERQPPFYGLEAADIVGRHLISFDTETYRFPVAEMGSKGKPKRFVRRKAPRPVVATFSGLVGSPIPTALWNNRGAKVVEERTRWSAAAKPVAAFKALSQLLDDDTVVLGGVNIAFDMGVMAHKFPALLPKIFRAYARGRIIDASIREMLLLIHAGQMQDDDVRRVTSLEALCAKYLHIDVSGDKKGADIWRVNYHKLDGVSLADWPAAALTYALGDAVHTHEVIVAQAPVGLPVRNIDGWPATTTEGGVVDELRQTRSAWALHLMGLWGMRVDRDVHEVWKAAVDAKLQHAEVIARMAGFMRPNGTIDKKRLQEMVRLDCEARGVDVPLTEPSDTFPDGQIKVAEEVLVQCTATKLPWEKVNGEIEMVQPLVVWGQASFDIRMRSTYLAASSLGIDHALLYDFMVLVATGRTSGRGPNMQNPPKDGPFREQFIPRPGMVFCSTDYSALELRTLAQIHMWYFGRSALQAAFVAGKDPHVIMGAQIAGMSDEEFAELKVTDKAKWQMFRQLGKPANFGAPGGLGAETFIEYALTTYGVDLAESAVAVGFAEESTPAVARAYAKHLIRKYKDTWDEAGPYMDMIGDECRATGAFSYVQPMSWRVRGSVGYCNGNNTGFQGLAADGAKDAGWRLACLCYLGEAGLDILIDAGTVWSPRADEQSLREAARHLEGVRQLLFIHDEFISEGPAKTAHDWAHAQANIQMWTMEVYTPDVPQLVQPALMSRWYKKAEPEYDDQGTLVPWAPPPPK